MQHPDRAFRQIRPTLPWHGLHCRWHRHVPSARVISISRGHCHVPLACPLCIFYAPLESENVAKSNTKSTLRNWPHIPSPGLTSQGTRCDVYGGPTSSCRWKQYLSFGHFRYQRKAHSPQTMNWSLMYEHVRTVRICVTNTHTRTTSILIIKYLLNIKTSLNTATSHIACIYHERFSTPSDTTIGGWVVRVVLFNEI